MELRVEAIRTSQSLDFCKACRVWAVTAGGKCLRHRSYSRLASLEHQQLGGNQATAQTRSENFGLWSPTRLKFV